MKPIGHQIGFCMDLQDRENFYKGPEVKKDQVKMAVSTAKLQFLKNLSKHLTDSAVFPANFK
jgi:hypothetical protein